MVFVVVYVEHNLMEEENYPMERKKVLTEICSFKEEISELDFAGGDPLFDKESREIIREAIDILGREKVSVTTTGVGVAQLSTEDKYLYRCEFSFG